MSSEPTAPSPDGTAARTDGLAALPQVDALVQHPTLAPWRERLGHAVVTGAVRTVIDEARAALLAGVAVATADADTLGLAVAERLAQREDGTLVRVINATGTVLHTNLGRAPLSRAARDAVLDAAGYSTLEYDRTRGTRGSRTHHLGVLTAQAAGTEAATVVNNGAGALLLVLAALAHGREVIVSRGELVEIGGSYRLPEIMAAAGVRLVEVGTTNRTRVDDYRRAVTEDTTLLLKVHRSNFQIVGFTEEASIRELVALGREIDVPVVHDLGSGLLHAEPDGPLRAEPAVDASVADGVDLVVVSGDKLLGGPQAGLIAGREALVAACRRHPFARALRVDKLQRAALEATLAAHLRERQPMDVPVVAMLHADTDLLRRRAAWMASELADGATAIATDSVVGGGSAPGVTLPSWGVAIPSADPAGLAAALRAGTPPVIGRTEARHVVLDLRTVPPALDAELADLVLVARG